MKLIYPEVEFLTLPTREETLIKIANVAKVCYQSGQLDLLKENDVESASRMVRRLVKNGHWAMIEHAGLFSVKIITDRAIANEIVRHRLASYAQESTRYVNMSGKDINFIIPAWCSLTPGKYIKVKDNFYLEDEFKKYTIINHSNNDLREREIILLDSFIEAENKYNYFLEKGGTPQTARALLPLGVKTEIIASMNLREWKHFLDLRSIGTTGAPHPDIKIIADKILIRLQEILPEIFGGQNEK